MRKVFGILISFAVIALAVAAIFRINKLRQLVTGMA